MFKRMAPIGVALALVAALGGTAHATHPHFIAGQTGATLSGSSLVVSFKEAGLGDNALVEIEASATATANWFCVNRGSAHPQAANKRTSVSQVSQSGLFPSDKNGNVVGQLTVSAPDIPASFSCPNGQRLELGSLTYSDVAVTDQTNSVRFAIAGTFSTGCLITGVRFNKVSCL